MYTLAEVCKEPYGFLLSSSSLGEKQQYIYAYNENASTCIYTYVLHMFTYIYTCIHRQRCAKSHTGFCRVHHPSVATSFSWPPLDFFSLLPQVFFFLTMYLCFLAHICTCVCLRVCVCVCVFLMAAFGFLLFTAAGLYFFDDESLFFGPHMHVCMFACVCMCVSFSWPPLGSFSLLPQVFFFWQCIFCFLACICMCVCLSVRACVCLSHGLLWIPSLHLRRSFFF